VIETAEGEEIERANHPMQQLRIPCACGYPSGTIIRKAK